MVCFIKKTLGFCVCVLTTVSLVFQPQDLALLLAHRYCLIYDLDAVDGKKVVAICNQGLPNLLLDGEEKRKKWYQMVQKTLKALAVSE